MIDLFNILLFLFWLSFRCVVLFSLSFLLFLACDFEALVSAGEYRMCYVR